MIVPKVDNPHGLSNKQKLVIADLARSVKEGKPIDPTGSTSKIYAVKKKTSAAAISSQNMNRPNFRAALIDELHKEGMIGPNSVVSSKLMEGLEAETKDGPDYATRLKYIQEIHKVIGVYAPQQVEKKSLNLNLDVTEEELDDKIRELQSELKS